MKVYPQSGWSSCDAGSQYGGSCNVADSCNFYSGSVTGNSQVMVSCGPSSQNLVPKMSWDWFGTLIDCTEIIPATPTPSPTPVPTPIPTIAPSPSPSPFVQPTVVPGTTVIDIATESAVISSIGNFFYVQYAFMALLLIGLGYLIAGEFQR